uniref:Atlastin-2 n=1 Tax=Lygus hesperus TaxID=30085 RepID=A0A0A9Z9K3_LYGHE
MTDSTCGVPGRGSGSSDENLFREQVKMLIPSLLEPENLILKRINGELVTAEKLFELMGSWVDKLNGFDLPDVSTLYRPSLQADNSMIEKAALELYVSRMDNAGCVDNVYVDPVILESWHEKALFVAMQFFKERHEYDSSLTKNYKMELIDSMITKYREIRDENYRRYKDYSPLMWVPVFSFALITISILTSKRHLTNTEDSSMLHWAVPLSFWLGVTGLFHWGQLVYEFIEFEALKCMIRRAVIVGMIAYLLYNVYLSFTLAKVK